MLSRPPNGEGRTNMSDHVVDDWRYVLRAKVHVHRAMAKLALTLAVTLREAEKREVDAETGSQLDTQRERALWTTHSFAREPSPPYSRPLISIGSKRQCSVS